MESITETSTVQTMSIYDIQEIRHVGVAEDLPFADYKKTPGLNPSTIARRKKSAMAARFAYEQDVQETQQMVQGRFYHAYLFEPDRLEDTWIIHEGDRRGNSWKRAKADAEANGMEVIQTDGQYGADVARERLERLIKPELNHYLEQGVREVSLFTGSHGLQCKGRLDWVDTKHNAIIDAKFTNDVTPFLFDKTAGNFSYHIKMALYRAWLEQLSGKKVHEVILVAIQTKDELDSCLRPIPEAILEDGLSQGMELIQKISEDLRLNQWHGVDEGQSGLPLQLPYYFLQEEQEEFVE